jgi:PAS domain S-box-containing protein
MNHSDSDGERKNKLWPAVLMGSGIVILINFAYFYVEKKWLGGVKMNVLHAFHLLMGVWSTLILVRVTGWHIIFRGMLDTHTSAAEGAAFITGQTEENARLYQHIHWFINLRWLAISVSFLLIIFSIHLTALLPEEAFSPLIMLVAILTLSNVVYAFWARRTQNPVNCIIVQVLSDLVILTGFIHFSGGLENPLYILYSLHVIISGILLSKRTAYALALTACGLLGFMAMGELFHFMDHYSILFFPHEAGAVSHASHSSYYVLGRFFPFAGILLCVAYFTTLVMDYLRKNEKRLEQLAIVASTESQKLETAVNAVGAGMLLLDRNLRVVWFNKRYQEWFNHGDHILGQHCKLGGDGSYYGNCEECISAEALEKGLTLDTERKIISPDKGSRFYQVTASPIRNENGEVIQVVELIQDITARKAMELEMLHTGKMAVLGRMAAGIAHEIGNPLSSLSTRIRLMEARGEERFFRESLQVLQEQISRIRRIIYGISQFARYQKEELTQCNINRLVVEAMDVIKLDRRAKGVSIKMSLCKDDPVTAGSKDKLIQVFINIGLNAMEAMEGGGLLNISTSVRDDNILVSFKDTGSGLSDEAKSNLFDPFYTTKEQGLGLGLFICYSIINSYGGTIEMESERGEGTTFTISLPVQGYPEKAGQTGMQ